MCTQSQKFDFFYKGSLTCSFTFHSSAGIEREPSYFSRQRYHCSPLNNNYSKLTSIHKESQDVECLTQVTRLRDQLIGLGIYNCLSLVNNFKVNNQLTVVLQTSSLLVVVLRNSAIFQLLSSIFFFFFQTTENNDLNVEVIKSFLIYRDRHTLNYVETSVPLKLV